MNKIKDSVFIIALVVTIISYKIRGNLDDALAVGGFTIIIIYGLMFIFFYRNGDRK